jgi:hypothetical protein
MPQDLVANGEGAASGGDCDPVEKVSMTNPSALCDGARQAPVGTAVSSRNIATGSSESWERSRQERKTGPRRERLTLDNSLSIWDNDKHYGGSL